MTWTVENILLCTVSIQYVHNSGPPHLPFLVALNNVYPFATLPSHRVLDEKQKIFQQCFRSRDLLKAKNEYLHILK